MDSAGRICLLAFSIVATGLISNTWIIVAINTRGAMFRTLQPMMLHVQHIGGILGCVYCFFCALNPRNSFICMGRLWFGHVSFGLMLGSLLVKVTTLILKAELSLDFYSHSDILFYSIFSHNRCGE